MADTTVEAVFRIIDQASDPIQAIGKHSSETTRMLKATGSALDDLDATKNVESARRASAEVDKVTRSSTKMADGVERNTRRSSDSMERMARKGVVSVAELTAALKKFEHERATATVDVDIAKAEAKIRVLKHELRTVSTKEAQAELNAMGLSVNRVTQSLTGGTGGGGGPGLGGGRGRGGGGGGRGGGLIGGMVGAAGRVAFMAAAIALALPVIEAFSGTILALAGSLAQAVGGAGAVGVAGMGAFVVGMGAIVAAVKPALTTIKQAKQDQDAYNKSVQQYGRDSAQAAAAHKKYNAALENAPKGTSRLLNDRQRLAQQWRTKAGPAQASAVSILDAPLQFAGANIEQFSRITNSAMAAAKDAVDSFFRSFSTPEWHGIIDTLGTTFTRSLRPLGDGLANVALFMGRIAKLASPYVIRFFQAFARSSEGWADSATAVGSVGSKIGTMVDNTREWWNLVKAVGKLFGALLGSGADAGLGVVKGITGQFNEWTKWIKDNPAKMQDFFDRTIRSAATFAETLGKIAALLGQLADKLLPIAEIMSQIANVGSGQGIIGPLSAYGLYRFGRNRFGGRQGVPGGVAAGAGGAGTAEAAVGGAAAARGGFGLKSALSTARPLYAASRAAGAGRAVSSAATAGALGRGLAGTALRGAGKFALPITAIMAAFDFASQQGNFGNKLQNVGSGLTFGLINKPELAGESRNIGIQNAEKWLQTHRTTRAGAERVAQLQQRLSATVNPTSVAVGDPTKGTNTFRTIAPHFVVEGKERRRLQAELDKLRPTVQLRFRALQTIQAHKAADDIAKALDVRLAHKGSDAIKHFSKDYAAELKKLSPVGKRIMTQDMVDVAASFSHGTKRQQKIAREMRNTIVAEYREAGKRIKIVGSNIVTGTDADWKRIQQGMSSRAEKAREEVSKSFTDLQNQAVAALTLMGFNKTTARGLIAGQEKGGKAAKTAKQNIAAGPQGAIGVPQTSVNRPGKAIGGRVPGFGLQDNQPLPGGARGMPGELVINAAQERAADMKLGGFGALERITGSAKTMHSVTKQQDSLAAMKPYAFGGPVPRVSGGSYGGVTPAIAALIRNLDSKGFHHGSTTSGGHAAHSYHYRGMAVDYGDAANDMQRLWNVVYPQRSKFAELFGPSRTRPGPHLMHSGVGFTDATLQSQHENHIHMAIANGIVGKLGANVLATNGGSALAAMTMPPLKAKGSALPGVPGALSGHAQDVIASAMTSRINDQLGSMGPGAGGAPVGGGSAAPPGQVRAWLTEALKLTGHFSAANLNALYARTMQESGGNPHAVNNWDSNAAKGQASRGLLQTIPATFAAYAMPGLGGIDDPIANAVAAIRYMFARYHHIVGATGHGYAKGGRIGYVGDSLGVGTEPYLEKMLGHMPHDVKVGRSSASGVQALKRMSGLSSLVFDLGTNDGSAKMLSNSLRAADRMTGNASIYVPTVRGPGAASKNAALRRMAGGDISLIPWAGNSRGLVGGDGIHATATGYKARADMLAHAMSLGMGSGGGSTAGKNPNTMSGVSGWFANGGSFEASKPTIIGVGESGRERVTITPASHRRAGGSKSRGGILVEIGHIDYRAEGDISKAVEKEFRTVARKLRNDHDDEDELG